ncbi:hypothetical protein NXV03_25990 [Phocaeicola vulgatus]|nr:hypothetical protein [Phocaeicola vulgatus]
MAEEGEDFTTWEVEVQTADQISWYKEAMKTYEKGYNIVFKVNEANGVTVSLSRHGSTHPMEKFCFRKRCFGRRSYYCEAVHDVPNVGGFGQFKEILYLPAK